MKKLTPSQNEQKTKKEEAKKLVKTIGCLEAILLPINQILHDSISTISCFSMQKLDKQEITKWKSFLKILKAFEKQINDSMNLLNSLDKKADEIEVLNEAKKSTKAKK